MQTGKDNRIYQRRKVMNLFPAILFTALLAITPYLVIRYSVLALEPSSEKKVLTGITAASALLLLIFFIMCISIPGKTDRLISQTIALAEEQIENIRPGYTDTVLDKSQAEALISGSIRISSGIDNYPETALLFKGGRLKAYKKLMDSFAGNADRYLKEFEESGTEFTLHNIFLKLQEKSKPAVMKTAMILEILVIAIAVIFYSGIILTATGMKKGWFKARNRSLTFGEDVR